MPKHNEVEIFKEGDRIRLTHSQKHEELPSDIKVGTLGWVYGIEFDENEGYDLLDCGWDDGDTWSVYAWEVEHA